MTFGLWDRIRDWVLLVVLLAVSVAFILARNEPLLRGLRAASLESTAWLEARMAWVGGYLRALDENRILREENISLSSEVARSREAVIENRRIRRLLAFRDTTSLQLRAARIISKDFQSHLLTLDVGRTDSIRADMPVIDERGVLGKTVLVSDHYARVMPYLNPAFRLPVKVQPSEAAGVLRWEGEDRSRLRLDFIVKTEHIENGQRVVTSGFSSLFPAGIPVGVVDSVRVLPGRNQLTIYVRPAAPISDAEHAFVILNEPDPELLELERTPIQ